MAKTKSFYRCQQCGATSPKWLGQCPACREWNSLVEEIQASTTSGNVSRRGVPQVTRFVDITQTARKERIPSGLGEFDRVLGGGIVPGSVVLIAGEPGIGKSTLLTQLSLALIGQKKPTLYVCGEESIDQVGLRIRRLLPQGEKAENLALVAETVTEAVVAIGENEKPDVMIIDSIQTMESEALTGMAGSVGQVRESAHLLMRMAKKHHISVFIVGHVTKEGAIAGPKVLEHMVDVVLHLEGERTGLWRILRTVKNRFGATDEVGVFAMEEGGLTGVENPSGAFLEESQMGMPGSAVVALMEGTRPILVEVQALTVESQLAMPRRVTQGISLAKLQVLAAVLQRWCKLPLGSKDIFISVAGGLKITEPAADLGISLALASSVTGKPLPKGLIAAGEVGLLGEIRRVSHLKKRIQEAKRLGYGPVISVESYQTVQVMVKDLLGSAR